MQHLARFGDIARLFRPLIAIGSIAVVLGVAVAAGASTVDDAAIATSPADRVTTTTDRRASSAHRRLVDTRSIFDNALQPKSVVATGDGLFFTQNMMYRHNVTVFDRSGAKVATIPDRVDLAAFGVPDGGVVQGSPVEAAVTPDGRSVYVSNYKMYGPGFNPIASDDCGYRNWDPSYVYEIDVASLRIVDVIQVGAVPKYLDVSPDGTRLVVSNWCTHDVTIIDATTNSVVATVPVGRHPRGIAITPDSRYAFVAVMGAAHIDVIDLVSFETVHTLTATAGRTPRHLQLSPDGRTLYVSNHTQNSVRKIDVASDAITGIVTTGTETRTMVLSDDGDSLYVVNYRDGTVSKVRTHDMAILQTVYSGTRPIGITYDAPTRQIWVSNYVGSLRVFTDE